MTPETVTFRPVSVSCPALDADEKRQGQEENDNDNADGDDDCNGVVVSHHVKVVARDAVLVARVGKGRRSAKAATAS